MTFAARPDTSEQDKLAAIIGSNAPDAIGLGRYVHDRLGVSYRIRYGGDQGIVVIGPNGKGKGTRLLMPNLLQLDNRSIIAIDPKGELAAVTAPYRRTLGRVVILNPFGVLTNIPGYDDLRSEGFNPLARLDPSADSFNADAAQLADALISVEGKEPFFSQAARALIAALIMWTVVEARQNGNAAPTMARVRELLNMPSDEPHAGNNYQGFGLPILAQDMIATGIPGLANKAQSARSCDFGQVEERTLNA